MKTKCEVPQAVKQFTKEVSTPDATIFDTTREQNSQDMSKLLDEICTILRIID